MPPSSFSIAHIFMIGAGAGLIVIFRNLFIRTDKKIVKYLSSSVIGIVIGIIAAYFLAHALCGILYLSVPYLKNSVSTNYRFTFWTIFVGFSMMSSVTGWFLGIIFSRKLEQVIHPGDEKKTESMANNNSPDAKIEHNLDANSKTKEGHSLDNVKPLIEEVENGD